MKPVFSCSRQRVQTASMIRSISRRSFRASVSTNLQKLPWQHQCQCYCIRGNSCRASLPYVGGFSATYFLSTWMYSFIPGTALHYLQHHPTDRRKLFLNSRHSAITWYSLTQSAQIGTVQMCDVAFADRELQVAKLHKPGQLSLLLSVV